jgi:hypothetical protein
MGRTSCQGFVLVKPLTYFDLLETFPESGCPICTLLLHDVDQLLDSLLYERVTVPESHRSFRDSFGLCNGHAWQLTKYKGNSLGTAILYRAVVDEALQALDQPGNTPAGFLRWLGSGASGQGSGVADALEPDEPCMACQRMTESEQTYAQIFIQHIAESRLQEAYAASPDGFCLPHFRLILRQPLPTDVLRLIVQTQRNIWQTLHESLTEFVDKNRHERMGEAMGSEGESGQRAIGMMAGVKGAFGLQPRTAK